MNENRKKLSLLTRLDNIISNDCINDNVGVYRFSSITTLIINDVVHHVSHSVVIFTLYFDELCVEICNVNGRQHYNVPYNLIKDIYILFGGN